MKIYNKLANLVGRDKISPTAIALGMFDGVHQGHRSIVKRAKEIAAAAGGLSAVFTFANHPLATLAPEKEPLMICSRETKLRIFEELGADMVFNIPFTKEFSRITPENFLALLKENLAPKYLVTGNNFTFGAFAKGNKRTLLRLVKEYGFTAEICPTVNVDGKTVSSTRIRALIAADDLQTARELLGAPFTYGGFVVHGDARGRKIGFPTANLIIEKNRAMPNNGAYAARVSIGGEMFDAVANIGDNPTFDGKERRLEVNLQNFSRDIYGKYIEVEFLGKLREEIKFSGVEELTRQLNRDCECAAKFWGADF